MKVQGDECLNSVRGWWMSEVMNVGVMNVGQSSDSVSQCEVVRIVLNVFRSCYLKKWFWMCVYVPVSTFHLLGPCPYWINQQVTQCKLEKLEIGVVRGFDLGTMQKQSSTTWRARLTKNTQINKIHLTSVVLFVIRYDFNYLNLAVYHVKYKRLNS